jgi:hypothetical protein
MFYSAHIITWTITLEQQILYLIYLHSDKISLNTFIQIIIYLKIKRLNKTKLKKFEKYRGSVNS